MLTTGLLLETGVAVATTVDTAAAELLDVTAGVVLTVERAVDAVEVAVLKVLVERKLLTLTVLVVEPVVAELAVEDAAGAGVLLADLPVASTACVEAFAVPVVAL